MAITIQYVVEHKGVEKLITTDKKQADQYDKMLDVADNLADYLTAKGIKLSDELSEELSILMARNKDAITKLLKGAKADDVLEQDTADVHALERKQA